ncbi:hypothetical protein Ccrd_005200 [Cynara cardunculus var. scolymus]|uniref:Transmembrane protein n=1 Tax=Cynara cardunculus var. scolymus TaxID=59895 RepID=A0A103XL75_CYNCS|nr:hypothetical protein Ccrd_005200 [Cynara cardunculus var. scolymus]
MYVASSCSILVIDRGNQAIREIQLHEDDCSSYQYDSEHHLGIVVLGAAVFFGFMLALLQRRVSAMSMKSVRPPLIPPEDEHEKEEEGLFGSLGKALVKGGTFFGGLFFSSKKNPLPPHHQMNYQQPPQFPNSWPMQETFMIPHQDAPPSLETRKSYPFVTKNPEITERPRPSKQTRYLYSGQRQMQQLHENRQEYHQKHHSSDPRTYYEEKSETTNEVVFGAVQEQDGKHGAVVIKPFDYSNPTNYSNQNVRSRYNYTGYAYGTYS